MVQREKPTVTQGRPGQESSVRVHPRFGCECFARSTEMRQTGVWTRRDARHQDSRWASSLALGLSLTARPPRLARELSNPPLQRQMEPSEKMACNGEQEPGWAGLGEASAGQM